MKKILINIKADPDDRERWKRAAEMAGTDLSSVIRLALHRFADRVEKKAAAQTDGGA